MLTWKDSAINLLMAIGAAAVLHFAGDRSDNEFTAMFCFALFVTWEYSDAKRELRKLKKKDG